jgi:hypothetical protein
VRRAGSDTNPRSVGWPGAGIRNIAHDVADLRALGKTVVKRLQRNNEEDVPLAIAPG